MQKYIVKQSVINANSLDKLRNVAAEKGTRMGVTFTRGKKGEKPVRRPVGTFYLNYFCARAAILLVSARDHRAVALTKTAKSKCNK